MQYAAETVIVRLQTHAIVTLVTMVQIVKSSTAVVSTLATIQYAQVMVIALYQILVIVLLVTLDQTVKYLYALVLLVTLLVYVIMVLVQHWILALATLDTMALFVIRSTAMV